MLKRRAAGFLRSDKVAALFTKIGKVYAIAEEVCRKVQEQLQQQADLSRSELSHLNPLLGSLKLCLTYHGSGNVELDHLHFPLCVEETKWGKFKIQTPPCLSFVSNGLVTDNRDKCDNIVWR